MKNDRDERTRPHVPTSPEECDPNSATVQRWQPKRLPLREGIAQASWFCRIMYILIVLGTGALNLIYWQKLPDTLVLRTWFGYSAGEVHHRFLLYRVISPHLLFGIPRSGKSVPVQKKGVYSADLLFGQLLHDRGAAANHGGVRHITVVSQSGPSVGRAALYGDPCVFLQAKPMSMNIMEEL